MDTNSSAGSPLLAAHFTNVATAAGDRGPVGEIVQLLATGTLAADAFERIVESHGAKRESWFRGQVLDLVLGYVSFALVSGRLAESNLWDVRLLRRHMAIPDGEFMDRRPAELAAVLNDQLDRILDDGIIDGTEELYQVELQAAFGLAYDDYLALTRRAFERAYAELTELAARDRTAVGKLRAIEPLYRLVTSRPRSLGALF